MEFLAIPVPEEIRREEGLGNFLRAQKMVKEKLESDLPSLLEKRLEYELERIKRIQGDYTFSAEEAKKKLAESVEGFSEGEYEELMGSGKLDYRVIEGKNFFEKRFLANLGFLDPQYKKRMKKDSHRIKARKLLHKRLDELIDGAPPKTYRVVGEITVRPSIENITRKKLRCWLPFPKKEDPVLSTTLLESSHKEYILAPNNSSQRTIYMEDTPQENLIFSVKFEYRVREQMNSIDPARVTNANSSEQKYLRESPPHIVFSPYLQRVATDIVGDETNPYLKAKKIYEWITTNVRYSYMHTYSTYENLTEFCVVNLRGDCGVQALLFITLCRIIGVPSGWQSGWYANPQSPGPHDWAVFYIEPYGWLPADLSFGGARRETPRYREFYFGNLDAFRMVANTTFMGDLTPKKQHWRSDPYDNQMGEMETKSENLYYDAFDYEIKIHSFEETE
ncbi:MAG: transglutaminase-like domain-containing protein [Euryarchaeota archaeon]|nr:transglutaminase-like domain-containing protein [Euryarchaeota archaeon]